MNRNNYQKLRNLMAILCLGYVVYCGSDFMLVKPLWIAPTIFWTMQLLTVFWVILWMLSGLVILMGKAKFRWIPLTVPILNLTFLAFGFVMMLGKMVYLDKIQLSYMALLNCLPAFHWSMVADVMCSLLLVFLLIRSKRASGQRFLDAGRG